MTDYDPGYLSTEELANVVAEILYIHSAPDLPQVCDRLQLPPSELEPMSSKRQYVRARVRGASDAVIEAASQRVVQEFQKTYSAGAWRNKPVTEDWVRAYEALDLYIQQRSAPPQRLNLVFATTEKPDIVIVDVPTGRIADTEGKALIYSEPIDAQGLTFGALKAWWIATRGDTEKLYPWLRQSLDSNPERNFFDHYYRSVIPSLGQQLPALLPQVWLQYDPVTLAQRAGKKALARQRLDFVMFAKGGRRIVIEIDGPTHISDADGRPDFAAYQAQLVADRGLMLDGYEVYRFGADELSASTSAKTVDAFVSRLKVLDEQ